MGTAERFESRDSIAAVRARWCGEDEDRESSAFLSCSCQWTVKGVSVRGGEWLAIM